MNPTPVAGRTGSARRTKLLLMVTIIAGSALALLSWTQTWYSLEISTTAEHPVTVAVAGSVAAPAITALSLAGIALVGALAIAGPVLRLVFGVLEVLLGLCVFLSALVAELDPIAAGSSAVTETTGVSGRESVQSMVAQVTISIWPIVAIAASVIMIAAGIGVLATARRWPGSSRKYQAVALEDATISKSDPSPSSGAAEASAEGHPSTDPAVTWDELSRGSDPTE